MSLPALINALFPSMFHRRLLLLLAMASVLFAPLLFRLTSLTLVRGTELREDAERRLVRRQWTPTVRGSILDRKGRILAQDRPSYDVAVDYPVITGAWVDDQSRRSARRAAGVRWADMDKDQREALTTRFRSLYLLHLDAGWNELARRLHLPRSELDSRRDKIVNEIGGRQRHNTEAQVRRSLARMLGVEPGILSQAWEHAAAEVGPQADQRTLQIAQRVSALLAIPGKKPDESELRSAVKHAEQPIAEVTQPQVLASRVPDDVGFSCRRLAWDEVELDLSRAAIDPAVDHNQTPVANPDLMSFVDVMPGLVVLDGGDRDYPFESAAVPIDMSTMPSPLREQVTKTVVVDGLATHILGRIRTRVQKEDIERRDALLSEDAAARGAALLEASSAYDPQRDRNRDRGAYRERERVGDTGVESSQESRLRGLRGLQTSRLDTEERIFVEPVGGEDVQLTLDIMLQARVQAIMSPAVGLAVVREWQRPVSHDPPPPNLLPIGSNLDGAAVVLDIDSGDVLAMVTMPTYTRAQAREDPESVYGNPLSIAYLNRAIAKPYQPGSVVKPLILVGAVQQHKFDLAERIACTGHFYQNQPNMFRCWIYKQYLTTHSIRFGHDLSGAEGIMASCNIFFFTLGSRLGVNGITQVYSEFGVGDRFNLGVGPEFAGGVGFNGNPQSLKLPDAVQMGIGQGPITWTPLHAAAAYATLARSGIRCAPRLIMARPRPETEDLDLSPAAVTEALEGLSRSVNDAEGTGNHLTIDGAREPIFNAPGVKVWGKTGTAAASPVVGDPDGEEGPEPRRILAAGDHSWFVVIVGRDRPRYVIAVVTDFGGSGGKVSGPICNQIIHALIAEGYL